MEPEKRAQLEALFAEHGFSDYKWIEPKEIVVAQWVRLKCMFGCGDYGQNASCPPNVPSVAECRQFFDEYTTGVIFHLPKQLDRPEDRHAWSRETNQGLHKLENMVFLSGYHKAFLLAMDNCHLCPECGETRETCKQPKLARPSPEALGMDVFATVRRYGFPIQVLADYDQPMNRYAFLLIE